MEKKEGGRDIFWVSREAICQFPQSQISDPCLTTFPQWNVEVFVGISATDAASRSFSNLENNWNIFIFYLLKIRFKKQNNHIQIILLK